MPLIKLYPMSQSASDFLIFNTKEIRRRIKVQSSEKYGLSSNEVAVNAMKIGELTIDPVVAELYLEIQTEPEFTVESVADEFQQMVMNVVTEVWRDDLDRLVDFAIMGGWAKMLLDHGA